MYSSTVIPLIMQGLVANGSRGSSDIDFVIISWVKGRVAARTTWNKLLTDHVVSQLSRIFQKKQILVGRGGSACPVSACARSHCVRSERSTEPPFTSLGSALVRMILDW